MTILKEDHNPPHYARNTLGTLPIIYDRTLAIITATVPVAVITVLLAISSFKYFLCTYIPLFSIILSLDY